MSLDLWLINPHDTVIFRDGKPFNAIPGSSAQTRPFPFPSTIAGAVRSQAGLNKDGIFDVEGMRESGNAKSVESHEPSKETALDRLKKLPIRGPFLIRIPHHDDPHASKDNKIKLTANDWYLPAPGDAFLVKPDNQQKQTGLSQTYYTIRQLQPRSWSADYLSNNPSVDTHTDQTRDRGTTQLLLVGQIEDELKKPAPGVPQFWTWERFADWLIQPSTIATQSNSHPIAKTALGIDGPTEEQRVHVNINHETRTGQDQMLFETRSLRFTHVPKDNGLANAQHLGLAVLVGNGKVTNNKEDQPEVDQPENPFTKSLRPQFSHLGGERRIVSWQQAEQAIPAIPECPPKVIESIINERRCRLILLTPGIFEMGYYPSKLFQPRTTGVTLTLKACKVTRPDSISGWDIDKNEPKASRRLVPAGSVYFIELHGASDQQIKDWLEQTWFSSISDQEQDQLDGFGIVAIGTWSGIATTPEEK